MNKERLYEKLEDYKKASARLNEASKLNVENDLINNIIIDGVIQRFEFTFELSWKLMKIFLEYTGISDIRSPRGAIREAFAYGLIRDGEQWIDMLVDRNNTSHIYDEEEAKLIYEKITQKYNRLLQEFADTIEIGIKEVK